MSAVEYKHSASSRNTYLLVPILLLFVLLVIAVLRAPSLISSAGIGSAIIVAAPLILATYALTFIAMAGRAGVDLSIGPLIGFINVGMIQLYAAGVISSPIHFFLYAIVVGVLYQLLMGLIVVFVRVQPIIVALSGYLALVGLNLVILPRPGGVAPEWMMPWGLGTSIVSPVLAILVIATLAWFLLSRSAFFGHLRLMGSDERTAYSAGVRIGIVRLGAHMIAGVYGALAAITFTALISSGDPTQGSTYTLMAVTALVLGGTSLAGGRGSIIGSLLGALNIYLITYVLSTFSFGMVQSFVTELAYGVVLVISLLLTLVFPKLPASVKTISPFAFFALFSIIALGVILHAKDEIMVSSPDPVSAGMTVLGAEDTDSGLTVLGGDSSESGLTVLGGDDVSDEGSGLTILGGDPAPVVQETTGGTALMIALVLIAVVLYVIYLLYRNAGVHLVVFVAILILLVLGITLYKPPGIIPPVLPVAAGQASIDVRSHKAIAVYRLESPIARADVTRPSLFGAAGSIFESTLASVAIILVGSILIGSLLVIVAVNRTRTELSSIPLILYLGLAAIIAVVIIYAYDGFSPLENSLFNAGVGFVVIGAMIFVTTLPTVSSRITHLSLLIFTFFGVTALAAMYFAAGDHKSSIPVQIAPQQDSDGSGVIKSVSLLPVDIKSLEFTNEFFVEVYWIILITSAIFLAALPRVWRRFSGYISFDQGVKALSYTGVFIVVSAILIMAALFAASDVPFWRFGVAIVAALVFARFLWHFLAHYRFGRSNHNKAIVSNRPQTVRQLMGVDR